MSLLRICLQTFGLGESTGKSPSKALLTLGVITDAVHQKDVWLENRWNGTDPTRLCSSLLTHRSTTTPCPPTGTRSPAAPVRSPLTSLLPLAPTSRRQRRRLKCRHRWKSWRAAGTTCPKLRTTMATILAFQTWRWTTISSPAWRISRARKRKRVTVLLPAIFRRVWSSLGCRIALLLPPPAVADVAEERDELWSYGYFASRSLLLGTGHIFVSNCCKESWNHMFF